MNDRTPPLQFRHFLSSLKPIPEPEWQACSIHLELARFEPRQAIQSAGAVCDRVLFLVSGLARTYVSDAQGRDFTWALHFGGDAASFKNRFLLDYASLIGGEASPLFIEALTPVEAVVLRKRDIDRLYAQSPFWNDMGRLIAEAAYLHTQQRTLDLLCLTAKERYVRLLRESPALAEAAPQHHLASYLGITPQSLSRIRRELAAVVLTKCE